MSQSLQNKTRSDVPNYLTTDKFLSGLISYDEYDERLKDWERLEDEAEI